MTPEQKAHALLRRIGFTSIKFTGRSEYRGMERITYTHENGQPVLDAPIITVNRRGEVTIRPWTDQLLR